MPKTKKLDFRYFWIFLWLAFTVTLAIWWVIFGTQQLERLGEITSSSELYRHQKMLLWEGLFLVALLLGGGVALLYLTWKEKSRRRLIEEFFAGFTHELKTSLASLRLQSESLQEDLSNQPESEVAQRLVSDTVRIEMQLENSLFLSTEREQGLFIEHVPLAKVLDNLKYQWPNLSIQNDVGESYVQADIRALESIFKNLLQNSVVHGKARLVRIWTAASEHKGKIQVHVHDDGHGFNGERRDLARLFHRHGRTSGSGIGLYICRQLVQKMDGEWTMHPSQDGFHVQFALRGGLS